MSDKEKVFNYLNEQIEQVKGDIKYFENFGNKGQSEKVMEQALRLERLDVLLTIKSNLYYGIRW